MRMLVMVLCDDVDNGVGNCIGICCFAYVFGKNVLVYYVVVIMVVLIWVKMVVKIENNIVCWFGNDLCDVCCDDVGHGFVN